MNLLENVVRINMLSLLPLCDSVITNCLKENKKEL